MMSKLQTFLHSIFGCWWFEKSANHERTGRARVNIYTECPICGHRNCYPNTWGVYSPIDREWLTRGKEKNLSDVPPGAEEIPPGGFMSLEAEVRIRLDERNKAVKIAYEFYEKHKQAFKYKEAAKNSVAYVDREIADVCRQVGNAISGHNALSVALKVTDEEIIMQELTREKNGKKES